MVDKENKLICPHCGQSHEEEMKNRREYIEITASEFTDAVFEDFWQDQKDTLKSLSKKEMAEEVFFQAISGFLDNSMPNNPNEGLSTIYKKKS